ncbi:uncharacterized protein LOC133185650 [Saccostrea echinata]|uniref:uncharacterized protein LOC133185650 n=1 Tax=Saccostrea echinata TaxID=191078 RepID=UPI002A818D10|nr:uncharacterized protein LOC133185650 [Saccostrea echinata]
MENVKSGFVLLLVVVTRVFGSMKETPQQIINKYNNYRTICTGLGYQNLSCKADNKAPEEGMYTFSWTILSVASKYFISEFIHDRNSAAKNI